MATSENIRAVGLILQECVDALYSDILPVYGVTSGWILSSIDDDLPAEEEVKAQLEAYEALAKLPISLSSAIQDVRASTGIPAEGIFYLPATVFPLISRIDGPVIIGEFDSKSFGLNLEIQKITLFCKDTGSPGDDLTVDIHKNGESIFSVLPTIAAASGDDVLYIIPDATITEKYILSADVLTSLVVSTPIGCRFILLIIWVKTA